MNPPAASSAVWTLASRGLPMRQNGHARLSILDTLDGESGWHKSGEIEGSHGPAPNRK